MIARTTAALLLCVLMLPDEGQWLPTQVRDWDWDALRQRGMKLTKDEFWHPENGGVLSATVQINGCTASFVSPDGLLITNHHCGFDAISELSTVEHNFLRDGFVAAERSAELPAPGMVAYVLKRIDNVTERVHAAQDAAKSDSERWSATQRVIAEIVRDGQRQEAGTVCSVASFLEGKEYHLYYRTQLLDVRLVYAPPRAVGEFGGEVDNWEWPRHTGDFSVFRAYAAPDGSPREHDPANVPYHPAHYLKVATDGVVEGDLAIIMGYPGRTQRYKSSRGVLTQQGYVYPRRNELLTAILDVLGRASATGEEKALQYAARIKQLANVQKNAQGMVFGLARNAVAERKAAEEAQFRRWVDADESRRARWGDVLDQLLAMDAAEADEIDREFAIGFASALLDDAPLLDTLIDACTALKTSGRVPPQLRKVLAGDLTGDLELVQVPVLGVILGEFLSLRADRRLRGTELLAGSGDATKLAADLVRQSAMRDAKAREDLFAGDAAGVEASEDPLLVLARGIAAERVAYQTAMRERQGRMLVVGRHWIEAQEAFRGASFYPDANSTLRVSLASVKSYVPRDGIRYTPHTTVAGLLQKETGAEPFANPKALLAAAATRKESRWFDWRLGDVPVCFLADGDTTGGNSGSPVVNGSGRLIGLNFDRVFENVAGDFGWSAERSRNVCCDIRYVLWIMDAVLPAPALLHELGL